MLLSLLKMEEEKKKKGKLKVFFGMCAGVGKTYDMLKDAQEAKKKGVDLVVGIAETHGRAETQALLASLPVIPRKQLNYRGTILEELDLDAVLARNPKLALVDELAHTNAPGSRHTKRYQDVCELLDNGIDVYTTLNVQHLESRADAVARITGTMVRETVPDSIFESADEIEVIDISPDELLKRFAEGKVYAADQSRLAIENFFRKGNLTALREMSLRMTAERVHRQLRDYKQRKRISDTWKSGARIVVGINASPDSISLIRSARRVSFTMDASWVAVYVETSDLLDPKEKERLASHIKLARELGAELVSTSDDDIAGALIRVAREQNATQIIVGKPSRHRFWRSSRLIEDLLKRSKDMDIVILGYDDEKESGIQRTRSWFPETQSGIYHYLIAGISVLLVALLCLPFTRIIGYRTVSLILLFAVSMLPLRLGPGPVLFGATLAALAWNFIFIPPIFTFAVSHLEDVMMLGTFLLVAAVTGLLSARSRTREKAVVQRERRTAALYTLTKDLSSAHSQDEVIQAAVSNIAKFFDADVTVFLGQADGDMSPSPHPASSWVPDEKECSVAAWTYWNEKKAGKDTDTLPFAQATYFCMSGPRYSLGVLGVRPKHKDKMPVEQETLLDNFVAQIASAVERELLNDVTKKSVIMAESERLYKTLFSSISHELRTPIATIMGASENLLSATHSQMSQSVREHYAEIHTASERLNRLVANLLDMTRLESGMIQPRLDWCDLGDLLHAVSKGLEQELADHPLTVNIPDDMPLVMLDFGLMEQALTNLVHNATVHTPVGTSILIDAHIEESDCIIIVADTGPGIPESDLSKVFDKFFRPQGTTSGGTGLGLPIAKGFVEAHKGTLTVANRSSGGVEFVIHVPVGVAIKQ